MGANSFRDEFVGAKAVATATVVGDLSKFYENISHSHLRREARQCGYSLRLLSLNISMYLAPRRCALGGVIGREVAPKQLEQDVVTRRLWQSWQQ